VGTGDKCGASLIDRNFTKLLKTKLGEKEFAKVPVEKFREGSKTRRDVEAVKNNFNGSDGESFLTLPREAQRDDDHEKGFIDGELRSQRKILRRYSTLASIERWNW
jgi:hypothetical protein